MSHAATNWAISQRGLKPVTKILLWHLADCHNPTMGCFPSQDYLAEHCEISRASVNRHLDELENLGLIERERRLDEATKKQLPTRYVLAFEKEVDTTSGKSRVSNSTTGRVSKIGNPVSQSCETPLTSKINLTDAVSVRVADRTDPGPWIEAAQSLYRSEGEGVFSSWFVHLVPVSYEPLELVASTRFIASYIETNYRDRIAAAFGARPETIEIRHGDPGVPVRAVPLFSEEAA